MELLVRVIHVIAWACWLPEPAICQKMGIHELERMVCIKYHQISAMHISKSHSKKIAEPICIQFLSFNFSFLFSVFSGVS